VKVCAIELYFLLWGDKLKLFKNQTYADASNKSCKNSKNIEWYGNYQKEKQKEAPTSQAIYARQGFQRENRHFLFHQKYEKSTHGIKYLPLLGSKRQSERKWVSQQQA